MRIKLFACLVITALVLVSAAAARIIAQSNRPIQNEEALGALLVEVRGLRAALEQMASAGPRAQLALARLQLQEQRVNTMLRRLDAVRDSLAGSQSVVTSKQVEIVRIEAALREESMPANERREVEGHLKVLRGNLVAPLAEVRRLTAEETSLASEISAEQARWADFNQRLEELERTLIRR